MAEPNLQKGSVRDLQAFLVVPMSGYSAFRIAEDVPVGNESPGLIGIEVKLKSPTRFYQRSRSHRPWREGRQAVLYLRCKKL